MFAITKLGWALAPLLAISSAASCCNPHAATQKQRDLIANNYLNIWNGDVSLIDSTFSPEISVHADRLPSSTGVGSDVLNITTSQGFRDWVTKSRSSWDQYNFIKYKSAGEGHNIAIRWTLDGIIGANFTMAPTTLKQGDPVTYNGTDFLVLNKCTGLIDEAHVCQDLITFFHNLGLEGVTV